MRYSRPENWKMPTICSATIVTTSRCPWATACAEKGAARVETIGIE